MKRPVLIALLLVSPALHAETPRQLLDTFSAEAARAQPGFAPSAQRGAALYRSAFKHSRAMPACTACHTDNPAAPGRHAVTGKAIGALAPHANAERFTDPAKVAKWFRRNCTEVVGRECSAAEKADFIQFMLERS
jgi:hypothetical protein